MRSAVAGLCLVAASFGLGATAAAQSAPASSEHAGHGGMQGMAMSDMPAARAPGGGTSALLTGPLGTRSPTGSVTVDGRTVRVAWSGDQPGSTRPWYVHKGSCGRDDGMVGAPSAYRPIAVDARGTGSGTATLPEPLAASGTYYVAVHSGVAGSPSEVVACGALGGGGGNGQTGQTAGMPGMSAGGHDMGSHDMSSHDMAGMDHSAMTMPAPSMPGTSSARRGGGMTMGPSMMRGATQAAGSAGGASTRTTMAEHMRMMADHMRMMADHMAMMAQASGADGAMANDGATARPMEGSRPRRSGTTSTRTARTRTSGTGAHAGMAMPRTAAPPRRPVTTSTRPTTTPAPAKRPAAPAPKRDSMPGMDHSKMQMPGMDHSKMPGMGRP